MAETRRTPGCLDWLGSTDPRRIGIRYAVTAFAFFLVGGLEAMGIRAQLMAPDLELVSEAAYPGLLATHATTMLLLALLPLCAGLCSLVVPIQIGAFRIALPRLHAFGYWLFLAGGIYLHLWLPAGAWLGEGWLAQIPGAGAPDADRILAAFATRGVIDYRLQALPLIGFAMLASGLSCVATVALRRPAGQGLGDLPVFVWMALLSQLLALLVGAALVAGPVLRLAGVGLELPQVLPGDLQRLWPQAHPLLCSLLLPAMGIVSEVLSRDGEPAPAASRVMLLAGLVLTAGSLGAWLSPRRFLLPGAGNPLVLAAALLALASWAPLLLRGRPRRAPADRFALGAAWLFALGVAVALLGAFFDRGGYVPVAGLHFVLSGAVLFGLFAGIYRWWRLAFGSALDARLGRLHFGFAFTAALLTFLPMLALGARGMPRRIHHYTALGGWAEWNLLASLASYVLAGSVLIFLYNALRGRRRRGPRAAGDGADAGAARGPGASGLRAPPSLAPPVAALGIFVVWLGFAAAETERGVLQGLGAVLILASLGLWLLAPRRRALPC